MEQILNYPYELQSDKYLGDKLRDYFDIIEYLGKGSFSKVYSVKDK